MSATEEKKDKNVDTKQIGGSSISSNVPPMGWTVSVRKDMVPDRQFSFEKAPAPVPARDIKETVTTEVLVVGAGLAGLSAALSAAEAGADTILIEKMGTFQTRGHHTAFADSRLCEETGNQNRKGRDYLRPDETLGK